MKKLLLIGVAALLATVNIQAQTNVAQVPNLLDTNSPVLAGLVGHGVGQDLELAALDLYGDIKLAQPFTTNGQATAYAFGGMNTSSKETVYGVMVTVPVSDHIALGGVVGNIGGTFYEGGVNISFGITNNWPVLGTVRSFAGDGVVYDFIGRQPANYAFTGFQKTWVFGTKWEAGLGVVAANTSDLAGVDAVAGAHVTYKWGAK